MKTVANYTTTTVLPTPDPNMSFVETRYTNPDRTEVTDGSSNWLATFTDGSRGVVMKGPTRVFMEHDMPLWDDFDRVRTGWGVLTRNGSWSLSGSADSSNSAVNSGIGTMTATATGTSYRATVITHAIQDADVRACVQIDTQATGATTTAGLITGYQDTSNHYIARVDLQAPDAAVTDDFSRNTTDGWGTATSGQSWTITGTAGDYSTTGTVGRHTLTALNVSKRSYTGSGTDFDCMVKISTSDIAAGGSLNGGIIGRYIDTNNHYIFRIRFGTTQAIYAAIQKQESGTVSTLGSEIQVAGLTHGAGTYYWVRAQASGTTLRMRIWQDGSGEPGTWDVSLTDSTFAAAGAVGTRSIANNGMTTPLPVTLSYDDFSCTFTHDSGDPVYIRLYKQEGGSLTSISSSVDTGLQYLVVGGDKLWLRMTMSGGVLQAKTWKDGSAEPGSWQVTANDSTFEAGRVGVRALLSTGSTSSPVTYTWSQFSADGAWQIPPTITHDKWVRIAPTAFAGTVDTAWLQTQLRSVEPDALEIAMQYIQNSLPISDASAVQIAGDASYGPATSTGGRTDGGDFNDYLGIPWTYTGVDNPEPTQFRCVDCSGYVRMVYGYRLGLPLSLTNLDGIHIPRVSGDISISGPGTVIIPHSGASAPLASEYAKLLPGDIIGFDADTTNPEEVEGQIDHIGIYLGQDSEGRLRFVSSRQSPDGPTFADIAGYSYFDTGTSLYARSMRTARRF